MIHGTLVFIGSFYILLILYDKRSIFYASKGLQQVLLLIISFLGYQETFSGEELAIIAYVTGLQLIKTYLIIRDKHYRRYVSELVWRVKGMLKLQIILVSLIVIYSAINYPALVINGQYRIIYNTLAEQNRSGSPVFPILQTALQITSVLSVTLPGVILGVIGGLISGSKGSLVAPVKVFLFSLYVRLRPKTRFTISPIATISTVSIVLIIAYVAWVLYSVLTSGSADITSYFDYAEGINIIMEHIDILPRMSHVSPIVNEYIPGISRILGEAKVDLFYEYFPYDMSLGKAPGLLEFENLLRLGIICYGLYNLGDLVIYKLILRASYATRSKLAGIALVCVDNFRLSLVILIFTRCKRKLLNR